MDSMLTFSELLGRNSPPRESRNSQGLLKVQNINTLTLRFVGGLKVLK